MKVNFSFHVAEDNYELEIAKNTDFPHNQKFFADYRVSLSGYSSCSPLDWLENEETVAGLCSFSKRSAAAKLCFTEGLEKWLQGNVLVWDDRVTVNISIPERFRAFFDRVMTDEDGAVFSVVAISNDGASDGGFRGYSIESVSFQKGKS